MNVKNEIVIGIIGSVLVFFLTVFFIVQYKNQQDQFKKISLNKIVKQVANPSQNVGATLTVEEVSKHNSVGDCWIIIQGSIYNVTQYSNLHPGGSDRIISFCGQDATSAYSTKGGKGSHSSQAYNDLEQLKLGRLNETVDIINTRNKIQNNIKLINNSGNRENDDD